MPRREFVTSHELFMSKLGVPPPYFTLLDVRVDHRRGTVSVIVDDPKAPTLPEAFCPVEEPFPR